MTPHCSSRTCRRTRDPALCPDNPTWCGTYRLVKERVLSRREAMQLPRSRICTQRDGRSSARGYEVVRGPSRPLFRRLRICEPTPTANGRSPAISASPTDGDLIAPVCPLNQALLLVTIHPEVLSITLGDGTMRCQAWCRSAAIARRYVRLSRDQHATA